MPPTRFTAASVVGTGMMGPGIALTLALGGLRVTLLGRSNGRVAQGLEKARAQAAVLTGNALAETAEVERALERLGGSTDFDASVTGADLVVESGPEELAWKREWFARMDSLARPEAVLASNTSGLSITAIAGGCRRPERVVTTHFWNPPHLMPLVEIVQGERTSAQVVEDVRALLVVCGKTPVVVRKDRPGQLGNRLQMALVREAANIVAEGIAGVADVDTVIREGLGIRMPAYGVFEHMDVAGLDLALRVMEYVAPDLYNEPHAPEYFRSLVREGHLGAGTGRGFYEWTPDRADGVRARRDAFLVEVLRYRRDRG